MCKGLLGGKLGYWLGSQQRLLQLCYRFQSLRVLWFSKKS